MTMHSYTMAIDRRLEVLRQELSILHDTVDQVSADTSPNGSPRQERLAVELEVLDAQLSEMIASVISCEERLRQALGER